MTAALPEVVDLSKYIEIRDGRPSIRGRRLPVAFIASAERENNLSVSQLAYDFTLTPQQVLAALFYYQEHQAEIDAQDAADIAASAEANQRNRRWPG